MVAIEMTTITTKAQAMRRERLESPKMVEMPGMEMPGDGGFSFLILAKGPAEEVSWILQV